MKEQKYENYKDSGANWLGEIPENWKVSKLKWHLRRIEPRNPGGVQVLSLYREHGIVPKDSRDDNHNVTSDDTSKYKYVQPGDFVVNKMKAWQGSVAVSDYEGIVSPAYYVYHFIDDAFYGRYFHYLLRGCYKDEFRRLSGGIRIGQWDLPGDALDNISVIIPPIEEQIAIADYLDDRIKEIDDFIDEVIKSVEAYKTWRQSLIHEVLTKGINKSSEMKKTKFEWIGDIPESYEVVPLYSLLDDVPLSITDGPFGSDMKNEEYVDDGVPVIQLGAIREYGMDFSNIHYITEEKADTLLRHNAFPGNIAIAKMMPAGKACIVPENYERYVVSADVMRAFISDEMIRRYVVYCLNSYGTIQAEKESNGSTRARINISKAKHFKIAIPKDRNVKKIVMMLDEKVQLIDELIAEKENLVEDLEKYKKSITYEIITGKRKVV